MRKRRRVVSPHFAEGEILRDEIVGQRDRQVVNAPQSIRGKRNAINIAERLPGNANSHL